MVKLENMDPGWQLFPVKMTKYIYNVAIRVSYTRKNC